MDVASIQGHEATASTSPVRTRPRVLQHGAVAIREGKEQSVGWSQETYAERQEPWALMAPPYLAWEPFLASVSSSGNWDYYRWQILNQGSVGILGPEGGFKVFLNT